MIKLESNIQEVDFHCEKISLQNAVKLVLKAHPMLELARVGAKAISDGHTSGRVNDMQVAAGIAIVIEEVREMLASVLDEIDPNADVSASLEPEAAIGLVS